MTASSFRLAALAALAVALGCNGAAGGPNGPPAKAPASRTAPGATATTTTPPPAAPPAAPPPPPASTAPTPGKVITPGIPADDVDLTTVTVRTGPPDVGDPTKWAVTAKITSLQINWNGHTGWQVLFTKRDGPGAWPNVPAFGPGPGQDLEYTLWAVVQVGGTWYTSGVIQLWSDPGQQLWSGGPPSQMAMNWWYDPGRWSPMTTHQPAVGEKVGFFVTAGNVRNNPPLPDPTQVIVQERSNVVVVPFPDDATGGSWTYP